MDLRLDRRRHCAEDHRAYRHGRLLGGQLPLSDSPSQRRPPAAATSPAAGARALPALRSGLVRLPCRMSSACFASRRSFCSAAFSLFDAGCSRLHRACCAVADAFSSASGGARLASPAARCSCSAAPGGGISALSSASGAALGLLAVPGSAAGDCSATDGLRQRHVTHQRPSRRRAHRRPWPRSPAPAGPAARVHPSSRNRAAPAAQCTASDFNSRGPAADGLRHRCLMGACAGPPATDRSGKPELCGAGVLQHHHRFHDFAVGTRGLPLTSTGMSGARAGSPSRAPPSRCSAPPRSRGRPGSGTAARRGRSATPGGFWSLRVAQVDWFPRPLLRQLDLDALGQQRRGDHEDHQQHQR